MREGERKYGPVRAACIHWRGAMSVAGAQARVIRRRAMESCVMILVVRRGRSPRPGITRVARIGATPWSRDAFYARVRSHATCPGSARPDLLIVIVADHFREFFMNNIPCDLRRHG